MIDLSTIANAIKSVQAPLPSALPSVSEEMKPVPQAEITDAVPPPPAKGGDPGLGEHLDLYAAEEPEPNAAPTEAEKPAQARIKTDLLGDKTNAPPPQTVEVELPFLKPLGRIPLGRSIDARI